MRIALLLVLTLFSALGCAQSATTPVETLPAKAPGRYTETMVSGGVKRRYLLQVPPAYDRSRRIPLVVLLHGWTDTAQMISARTGFPELADREGFALAVPEGLGQPQGWNVGFLDLTGKGHPNDAGFIANLIDQIKTEVGIDPARIYVAGHSNGAMLAYLVGAKYADRLAAIGVVAGTIGLPSASGGAPKTIPKPVAPLSAIIFHGTADSMVAYNQTYVALVAGVSAPDSARWWANFDGCGAAVRTALNKGVVEDKFPGGRNGAEVELVTIKNGTHDWPGRIEPDGTRATDLMWEFFKNHPRTSKP